MTRPMPYIERQNGDLIQADEWNEIQIQARQALQVHDHSGGEQGPRLSYTNLDDVPSAFPPAPHQHSGEQLEVGELSVAGKVGIGTGTPDTPVHIIGGNEAGLTSETGSLVIGEVTGKNLVMDADTLMARENGSPSELHLQPHGGGLSINGDKDPETQVTINNDGHLILGSGTDTSVIGRVTPSGVKPGLGLK